MSEKEQPEPRPQGRQPAPHIAPGESVRYGVRTFVTLFGISQSTFGNLVKEGVLPRSDTRFSYDLQETVRQYCDYLRGRTRGGVSIRNLEEERAKLVARQSAREGIRLRQDRDELVPVDVVESHWTELLVQLKERMRAIPSKLRSRGRLNTKQMQLLAEQIDRALVELADGKGLPEGSEDEDDIGIEIDAEALAEEAPPSKKRRRKAA